METFIPSRKGYESLLFQDGTGGIDRYIFHQTGQTGAGLGNFFSKIYRFAKPLISSGIKVLQPSLQDLGHKLVDAGSKAAISKIENFRDTAKQRIKRRKDNLDE